MYVKTSISLKMFIRINILLLSFIPISTLSSWSQSSSLYSYTSSAEKIYLQLDSKVYTTNKTIWFKAIVTNAVDNTPTKLSGVLYTELVDQNERIVEKKLVKLDNGIGDGFFDLNKNYAEGLYLLRAYTEWNKNFGPDFFFREYIRVFATENKIKASPVKNVTLIEGQGNENRIKAIFDPFAIDSSHTKDLTLFISLDDKNDTLSIKKNAANNYLLDYVVPADSRLITLQLQTKNHFSYSKTIILQKDYLDLQFFPESGELVQGLPGLLGFKALDSSGKGKPVQGEIVNGKGAVITSFKSNELGMGSVMLPVADSTEKYMARILSSSADGIQKMYALPAIAPKGNVLSVIKSGEKIYLKARSNYLDNDSIFIRVSCRGVVYFDIKGALKRGSLEFSLLANTLPDGIIDFTMMTASMTPVAERLYFNEQPAGRINISIVADKEYYTQRELAKLTIEAKDSAGQPVNANLSVLVLNKAELGQLQDRRQNILSYLLLCSELKGEIENPGFYFSKNISRYDDLNALLLTQGWRKYNYTRSAGKIDYQPEADLTVSGYVKGVLSQHKVKKEVALTMMTFGKTPTIQTQTSDSLGRFSFDINEESGQNLNILIQSKNKTDEKKDYTITLDKKESPPIVFNHIQAAESPDSIVQAYVKKSIERKKIEDAYASSSGGITLENIIIKSYLMTPERKMMADQYGKPKVVIDGNTIREKEAKWSYGLYSVLLFNFPDKVNIVRGNNGNLYARLYNGEITLVVIDGIPVRREEYDLIPSIPPSEVSSFEIIEYAKNFTSLYCEVFPQNCLNAPARAPAWGNVIAIYTYGKKGIFGVNRSVGIMKATVPVFAASREFYAPKYEQLKTEDWLKPDLRTLVHWEAKVNTDSSGRASVSFYNADNTGIMQVVVEAISVNGAIGYKELNFEVRERK